MSASEDGIPCNERSRAFIEKVNHDYGIYQNNVTKEQDPLLNKLTLARQILKHYKDHFNLYCTTTFSGTFPLELCSEEAIDAGLKSERKEMARELLDLCSLRVYGDAINQMAKDQIDTLEGRPKEPAFSCERDTEFTLSFTREGGCDRHDIKTSDDWGCYIAYNGKGLAITGWPQVAPLEIKKNMARHVTAGTTSLLGPHCNLSVSGPFFDNSICSQEFITGEINKIERNLAKFKADDSSTHLSTEDYSKFNGTLELLEHCSSSVFPQSQVWAEDKLESVKRIEQHDAIQLRKKESCRNIDLREEKRNGKSRIPEIRDQDTVNWCYAFTTADLLSYYTGENISALALSVKNYQELLSENKTTFFELVDHFDSMENFLDKVKGHNLCTEGQINSEDLSYNLNLGPSAKLRETLETIESFYDKQQTPEQFFCIHQDHFQNLFSTLNIEDFIDILSTQNKNTVFIELANRACNKENSISWPSDLKFKFSKSPSLDEIHKTLGKRDLVAVVYDIGLIASDMERGSHISTIVGRRYNSDKKQCEFLLRNSWGGTCFPQYKYECEGGYLWIPEIEVMKGLKEASYKE